MIWQSENGKLSLHTGAHCAVKGIRAYIVPHPEEKVYLPFHSCSETRAVFYDPAVEARVCVTLETVDSCTVLRLEGEYRPKNLKATKDHIHLYEEHALGIEASAIDGMQDLSCLYKPGEYWTRPMHTPDPGNLPPCTQALLLKLENTFGFCTALCDRDFTANFEGVGEKGFRLYAWSNTPVNSCNTLAAVMGSEEDVYALPEKVYRAGFTALGKDPVLRQNKPFPPILETLGWCTWDALHLDVSHEAMVEKAKEFREKGLPVHWFMLDDMWGHVQNNYLGANSTRELYSIEADPDRFPQGLAGVVKELKEDYGLKIGLWHPTTGYWHGIDPCGPLASDPKYRDLLFWSQSGILVPKFDRESISQYYDQLHSYYKNCGIDLIKVDNQACLRRYSKRVMPIGQAARNLHEAIEAAADKYYGGQLINCMGMPLANFWNRHSAVIRSSCDYDPDSRDRFNLLIRQNAFNSMTQGSVYYPDWDMWWTSDSQSEKNAACHAISGGPVYISDALNITDVRKIRPLILSNGTVLRMDQPARPTMDCLFSDPLTDGTAFKIFNAQDGCGAVIAYNISETGTSVSTTVGPADALLSLNREYVAYNPFTAQVRHIRGTDTMAVSLPEENDFQMWLFIPLEQGRAILGLQENLVCFAAVRNHAPLDDGTLLVYGCDRIWISGKLCELTPGENGLSMVRVQKNDQISMEE